jgi:hypothetical protein
MPVNDVHVDVGMFRMHAVHFKEELTSLSWSIAVRPSFKVRVTVTCKVCFPYKGEKCPYFARDMAVFLSLLRHIVARSLSRRNNA